jgi:hypothetical protein
MHGLIEARLAFEHNDVQSPAWLAIHDLRHPRYILVGRKVVPFVLDLNNDPLIPFSGYQVYLEIVQKRWKGIPAGARAYAPDFSGIWASTVNR